MSARKIDDNGFVTIESNPISRAGVFPYLGSSIGADDPDKIYYVYRPQEELLDPECIDSFKHIPIVDDHDMIGPEEDGLMAPEKKGVHGVTGERVDFRDGVLYANLKIFSETLKKLIASGKKELSLGYRCLYEKSKGTFAGQEYDYIQRSLRGNHLALVDQARCDVAVLDHHMAFDSLELSINEKETDMITDKDKAKDEEGTLTLESLAAKVEALVQAVAKLTEAKEGNGEVVDEDPATAKIDKVVDEDPAAAKKDEPAKETEEEKKASDEEAAKKEAGMDAQIKKLNGELEAIKKDGLKSMLGEISQRDTLAKNLSPHIGTFDHADKTLQEVAEYGVKKLGIQCAKGQEKAALDGFLIGRKAVTAATASMDKSDQSDALDSYINGKAA